MGKRIRHRFTRRVYRFDVCRTICAVIAVVLGTASARGSDIREWRVTEGVATFSPKITSVAGGTITLQPVILQSGDALLDGRSFVHPVAPGSTLVADVGGGGVSVVSLDLGFSTELVVQGGFRSLTSGQFRISWLEDGPSSALSISGSDDRAVSDRAVGLIAYDVDVRPDWSSRRIYLTSDQVELSALSGKALGARGQEYTPLASLTIELTVEAADGSGFPTPTIVDAPRVDLPAGGVSGSVGPDVIVSAVSGSNDYPPAVDMDPAPDFEDFVSAFSVGSTSCNISDEVLTWVFENSNQHPVIAQNLYRLHQNRFEQIGMSWVKHGFFATDGTSCGECSDRSVECLTSEDCSGFPCVSGFCAFVEGTVGLAPGCSDLYTAGLNGEWRLLGPRSVVNAHTGFFPGPPPHESRPSGDNTGRRLQVRNDDLRPSLNVGARYFNELQYVTPDDAAAENDDNNASYKPINILQSGDEEFLMATATGPTVQELPAIYAWSAADPTVVITEIRVPGEGLFVMGAKATDLNNGFFRYEYAIFNMNSDRSGGSFSVPLPDGASVVNIGFHDVFYHSGEPYDGTDWTGVVAPGSITWSTTPFATDANANALRWSTLYNFRFDASVVPLESTVTLGLFKPGTPDSVDVVTLGPALGLVDCNNNGISDLCDIDCGRLGCALPDCETSDDCNGNGIPDECEPDCNGNDIPDACDLDWETGATCVGCQGPAGTSDDCDANLIPDSCDSDCDGDTIPDACEETNDPDGDNVDDCNDLCPLSTPPGVCDCLPQCCCTSGICFDLPPETCLTLEGCAPVCQVPKCRDGCLLGDVNDDGDVDLADAASFAACFSGDSAEAGFAAPGADCLRWFDFDVDGDVDVDDYFQDVAGERHLFFDAFLGP